MRPLAPIAEQNSARPEPRGRSYAALVALALCLYGGVVCAGPEDDFKAGLKSYHDGDMLNAMRTLRKVADQGHAPSQVLLAEILDQASFDEEAVAYYGKAAAQGSADGEFGLAGMIALGEGVAPDPEKARELYERAAAKGHRNALNVLAQAYINGTLGLTAARRDNAKAVDVLTRAAESGFQPAMVALGRAYRQGGFGVTPDAAEASKWEARSKPAAGKAGKAPPKR